MFTMEWDEELAHKAWREDGREEGLEKGRAEGRAEGILDTLFGLVNDGVLTVKDAAARAGVSTSTFSRKMKAARG